MNRFDIIFHSFNRGITLQTKNFCVYVPGGDELKMAKTVLCLIKGKSPGFLKKAKQAERVIREDTLEKSGEYVWKADTDVIAAVVEVINCDDRYAWLSKINGQSQCVFFRLLFELCDKEYDKEEVSA